MSLKNFLRCLTVLICLKLVAMTDVKSWTNFDQSGRLDKILPSEKMSDLQNWQNFERSGNSSSALSRKRRFIFPAVTPWLFDIRVTMDIPLQGLDTALRAYIPFTWNLNTLVFVGRSLESRQVERFGILKVIEDGLERYAEVDNSHGCLLRTICEVARTPVSGDGLLGDIFNLLLTPISDVKEVLNPDNSTTTRVHFEQWQMDYIYAQHDGHFTRDCSSYHDDCPYSIFQMVEMLGDDATNVTANVLETSQSKTTTSNQELDGTLSREDNRLTKVKSIVDSFDYDIV